MRTSSKEVTMKNFNKMIHLTNDAVQKKGEEYGKFESGNKISFLELQRFLDIQNTEHKVNFFSEIYPRLKVRSVLLFNLFKNCALDCIKSVYTKIDPNKR